MQFQFECFLRLSTFHFSYSLIETGRSDLWKHFAQITFKRLSFSFHNFYNISKTLKNNDEATGLKLKSVKIVS